MKIAAIRNSSKIKIGDERARRRKSGEEMNSWVDSPVDDNRIARGLVPVSAALFIATPARTKLDGSMRN